MPVARKCQRHAQVRQPVEYPMRVHHADLIIPTHLLAGSSPSTSSRHTTGSQCEPTPRLPKSEMSLTPDLARDRIYNRTLIASQAYLTLGQASSMSVACAVICTATICPVACTVPCQYKTQHVGVESIFVRMRGVWMRDPTSRTKRRTYATVAAHIRGPCPTAGADVFAAERTGALLTGAKQNRGY